MKKIVAVVGSMRKGNSFQIARKLQEKFSVDVYELGGDIKYCTGCLACDETHLCVIDDKMSSILPAVKDCDVLVIITPTRYSLMSGDVKVFIDRLNPTAVSEELCGKKVMAIAIGQTQEGDGTVTDALKSIEFFAGNAGMDYLGGYPVYGCYASEDLSKKKKEIEKLMNWVGDILKEV